MRHTLLLSALVSCGHLFCVADNESTYTIKHLQEEIQSSSHLFSTVYANPALKGLIRDHSLNNVTVGWEKTSARNGQPYLPAEGKGENFTSFDAESYLRHDNYTLTGFAGYSNGKIKSVKWCETSDYDMVYPYILADSTGGDMKSELYRFGGSVSSSFSSKAIYGASVGYEAGLNYRNVDPRPRNVTGRLDISAGIGLKTNRLIIASAIDAMKYKQSNSVEFVSELGVEKLYHLTGLGTDYTRFAGVGLSTYYTGWRYGISVDMHPCDNCSGPVASVSFHRLSFTNILTDLNKLPIADVRQMEYRVEAGWRGKSFAVNSHVNIVRRLGNENIFGDATSGSYPEIASLTLYVCNSVDVRLSGMYSLAVDNRWTMTGELTGDYNHNNQIHSSPDARRIINNICGNASLRVSYLKTPRLLLETRVSYGYRNNITGRFYMPDEGVTAIIDAAETEYLAQSRNVSYAGATVSASIALPEKLALKITASSLSTTLNNSYSISAAVFF